MMPNNLPVTSREYKLMLNINHFIDWQAASAKFWTLIKTEVQNLQGTVFMEQDDTLRRQTWYLDTPDLTLCRQYGLILRQREDEDGKKKFKLTLKYRDPDRYIASSQDMTCTEKSKLKFEEDIIPPFNSKFSHSVSVKTKELIEATKLGDVGQLFPAVNTLPTPLGTPVETVNAFKAKEIVRYLGQIKFQDGPVIKLCNSFWYVDDEASLPVVAEFSFDYDAPVVDEPDETPNQLETYPLPVVTGAKALFQRMQVKYPDWFDLNATTKTARAYRHDQQQ